MRCWSTSTGFGEMIGGRARQRAVPETCSLSADLHAVACPAQYFFPGSLCAPQNCYKPPLQCNGQKPEPQRGVWRALRRCAFVCATESPLFVPSHLFLAGTEISRSVARRFECEASGERNQQEFMTNRYAHLGPRPGR